MSANQTVLNTDWTESLKAHSFSWAYFEFVIQGKETLYLPPYRSSALRGGFGNSFRSVCCTVRNQDCKA